MPAEFPHSYVVSLSDIDGKQAQLNYESATRIHGGPPKEFDGIDTDWSPEGFLIAGVILCFLTTLRAIHRNAHLKIENLNISGQGILDKTKKGLVFTEIIVTVTCSTNDKKAAEILMQRAKKYCLISNALITKPQLLLEIHELL